MSYAARRKAAHDRIRVMFGTDVDAAQLYVWHNGAQITAYQSNGRRGRSILNQILVKDDTISVVATKDEFTAVPVPNDEIKMGMTLATARTLRIDTVSTTHVSPSYELELIDPNQSTTAAAG